MEDEELVKLVYKKYALEGKSPKAIGKELGLSAYKVRKMLKHVNDYLRDYDKADIRNSILDSTDKMKDKFETLIEKAERILDEFERGGENMKALEAIKRLESLITTALKRLGELRENVQIRADKIDIKNLMVISKKIQERMFEENEATVEDKKLVFSKPKPELIENFNKYKKRVRSS